MEAIASDAADGVAAAVDSAAARSLQWAGDIRRVGVELAAAAAAAAAADPDGAGAESPPPPAAPASKVCCALLLTVPGRVGQVHRP